MENINTLSAAQAKKIRWLLTDIDDTLTKDGKLIPQAYGALWQLQQAGITAIAVTGRAAAWGYLLTHEWPVAGVITENGAVSYFIRDRQKIETLVFPGAERNTHPSLVRAVKRSLEEVPGAREAQDNYLRLYDIAIDYAENTQPPLSPESVQCIINIFQQEGCSAQASSIHVNCWLGDFNKRKASELLLTTLFSYNPNNDRERVFYVGDALNDEPMFACFPLSCGVANVARYVPLMTHVPRWVSTESFGWGFAEIVGQIISKRNQPDA